MQLIQNLLEQVVNRTTRHHHITPVRKSLQWLKISERIHFKVLFLTYNSLQSSQRTYLREVFTIQPTRSTRTSSCLTLSWPRSVLISCSPTELYPPLHHIFGITYHLDSAPFLHLHHCRCQSQDIIFIWLLYPSPSGLPLKARRVLLENLLHWLIWCIHLPNLNDTHLNIHVYSVPSNPLKIRHELPMDHPLDNPLNSSQRPLISWCPGGASLLSSAVENLSLQLRLLLRVAGPCTSVEPANRFPSTAADRRRGCSESPESLRLIAYG